MPTPTLTQGAPCWLDLYSSDTEQAKAFYGGVLGWAPLDLGPEYGGYFIWQLDGKAVGGCMANDGTHGAPDGWTTYLTSDDADRTCRDAAARGGQVLMEPMDVTQNGRFAIVGDPGGAAVGVWQPREVTGFDVRGEPGAPAWFELHTRAYDASVAFYRDVFRWDARTMSDEPEFRYTTHGEDDGALAGIMDDSSLPEGAPAAWAVYFEVADADAASARVVELGGSVEGDPVDTPYGRLASAADPTGARFRLMAN